MKETVNAFKVPGPPNQPQGMRKAEQRKDALPQKKKNLVGKQSQKQQGAQGKGKPEGQPFQEKGTWEKDSKGQ